MSPDGTPRVVYNENEFWQYLYNNAESYDLASVKKHIMEIVVLLKLIFTLTLRIGRRRWRLFIKYFGIG